jgi:ferric-dicitrate binding protein FerR (iron transport regulator)
MALSSIQELFQKYLDETITPAELTRLYELIGGGYDPKELDPLLEAAYADSRYAVTDSEAGRKEALEGLLDRIMVKELYPELSDTAEGDENGGGRGRSGLGWRSRRDESGAHGDRHGSIKRGWGWRRYAAVAAVLLTAGAYLLYNSRHSGVPVPAMAMNKPVKDIAAPTGAKTTLTLSGGQQILLDSAGSGPLAVQGGTSVRKLKNGQLAYENGSRNPNALLYNILSTAKGGQTMVVLADGTKVWLNALSSLRYPTAFPGRERLVELDGEAYFEVSTDKSKPFKVNIRGKGEVEVLGTHFNVNAYQDEPTINTTLLEGSVRVNRKGGAAETAVTIKPGQQAQMDEQRLRVDKDANLEEVMAWKNGYFFFDGANIEEIMRQVSRWYAIQIIYEGNVKGERFAGSLPRSANASKLLEVLSLTKTVSFDIQDNVIIVKPFHP